MKEILITSSVLILVLLALRALFRNRISRRVQYALWGLVLVRLLVPFNLPPLEHSVLTAAEPVTRNLGNQAVYLRPLQESISGPQEQEAGVPFPYETGGEVAVGPASEDNVYHFTDRYRAEHEVVYTHQIALEDVLRAVWCGGMLLTALWFLLCNLRFWRKLCKGKILYSVDGCRYPVYLVEEGLDSPCLFGLFRPAVYVTPAAVSSPERLRHVLAHETAHARHGDLLWSLLRCVCLVVYWFDPLVWIAAAASKTDCELACDEGALAGLEEAERLAYGKTLLALIPVRRGTGNPLLSATTMTAGKRQLKDRITRIAENRRGTAAALIAVILLACAACGATFTGGTSELDADAGEERPLTAEELTYFNEFFFNNGDLRSQFLSSNYERPEEIDLCALFYNGTGLPAGIGEEERKTLVDTFYHGEDPGVDLTKCPVSDMNQVLRENTGLGLEETEKVALDSFDYLEAYDAYYLFHGDTNAVPGVEITVGERKGELVYLYYEDFYRDDGWKRITLRETKDGYRFVSHMPCQRPVIPTVYPEGEPVLTLSLTELETPEIPVVDVERRNQGDLTEVLDWLLSEDGERELFLYRAADGHFRAALADGQNLDCFLDVDYSAFAEQVSGDWYEDVCGTSGFCVTYPLAMGSYRTAYYYMDAEDRIRLLAEASGVIEPLDLDGDGQQELVWETAGEAGDHTYLLFQREDRVYQADVQTLVKNAWPELSWWDYAFADRENRCIQVRGFVKMPEWGENGQADFFRQIYLKGEDLLVYADLPETVDHAAVDIPASIPEEVRKDALERAKTSWEEVETYEPDSAGIYDDWRLSSLSLAGTYEEFPIDTVEVYRFGWQAHAAKPTEVKLAGGMYLQEDGWVGGSNSEVSPYLVYQVSGSGRRARLESRMMAGDYSVDSIAYRADLCRTVWDSGLVTPEAFSGEDHYIMFAMDNAAWLNGLAEYPTDEQRLAVERLSSYAIYEAPLTPDGELFSREFVRDLQGNPNLTAGGAVVLGLLQDALNGGAPEPGYADDWANSVLAEIVSGEQIFLDLDTAGTSRGGGRYAWSPALGNGPNRVLGFQDFLWSWAEEAHPAGPSLTVASEDGTRSLTFWQGSETVRCVRLDQTFWLRAEEPDPEDPYAWGIFAFMRYWYDEAEEDALHGEIVVEDRGQSHLEIAQEWAERSCDAALRVTPGSKFACTYVKVTAGVDRGTDLPETAYPAWTEGKERFWFGFTRVFVPENEQALRWQMAGNTGDYTGSDPSVPAGAFEDWQTGVLYRTEEGWRCKETGTGP